MAEENTNGQHHHHNHGMHDGNYCCSPFSWHGRNGWFMALRWILGLIVLLAIFAFGMRIGELKGELEAGGYGYHGMTRTMPSGGMYLGQ